MQLKLDMSCHLLNVHTKFQIDISKHVEEKSGKRGRTLPRHNTSRFSSGRIKRYKIFVESFAMDMYSLHLHLCRRDLSCSQCHTPAGWSAYRPPACHCWRSHWVALQTHSWWPGWCWGDWGHGWGPPPDDLLRDHGCVDCGQKPGEIGVNE